MSTVSFCLYPFSNDNSLLAICMNFPHRYMKMRRFVFVYILKYKYISYFIKLRGRKIIQHVIQWEFYQFNLRIGAMRITACPSFVHCNWRSRAGRHRWQPVTLISKHKIEKSQSFGHFSCKFNRMLQCWLQIWKMPSRNSVLCTQSFSHSRGLFPEKQILRSLQLLPSVKIKFVNTIYLSRFQVITLLHHSAKQNCNTSQIETQN